MQDAIAKIDRALDELLVGLGGMVLRLAHPDVTRTADERAALLRSVRQFATCAARSSDSRVLVLADHLRDALIRSAAAGAPAPDKRAAPHLRLVSSRA